MKRILLSSLYIISTMVVTGQQQLENSGFETWDSSDQTDPYNEPTQWSSIKTSDNSFLNSSAPHVASRSTDSHSGSYSVRLENKSVFTIVANGIVTNGRIHSDADPKNGYVFTDASNSDWNTPFTDRPDSLVGWYKYAPTTIDHGKVEIALHSGTSAQLPENGTSGSFVGAARFDFPNATISSWTRFSVPFHYFNSSNPDYALTVLTAGDSTRAKNGSVAFLDDLELIYNPVSVEENYLIDFTLSYVNGYLKFNLLELNSDMSKGQILDLQGRIIKSIDQISNGLNEVPFNKPNGCYVFRIEVGESIVSKKFIVTN